LAACSPAKATAELAESKKAVAAFHADANARNFDDIYVGSGDEMQNTADIADFEEFLAVVQHKLGKTGKSTQEGWRINYVNGTSMTVLNMTTIYEKGEAMETFTFKLSPQGSVLVGYNIQSNALIMN
jgi:hypothetical protein